MLQVAEHIPVGPALLRRKVTDVTARRLCTRGVAVQTRARSEGLGLATYIKLYELKIDAGLRILHLTRA